MIARNEQKTSHSPPEGGVHMSIKVFMSQIKTYILQPQIRFQYFIAKRRLHMNQAMEKS